MEKEYQVVVALFEDFETFQKEVSRFLNEGWRCQGGICVVISRDGIPAYHQAMVKE